MKRGNLYLQLMRAILNLPVFYQSKADGSASWPRGSGPVQVSQGKKRSNTPAHVVFRVGLNLLSMTFHDKVLQIIHFVMTTVAKAML